MALCTGRFLSPAKLLTDSSKIRRILNVLEVETSSEKNSFETAGTVEGLDDFPEETAVEGKTASIEEEVPTTEAEDPRSLLSEE